MPGEKFTSFLSFSLKSAVAILPMTVAFAPIPVAAQNTVTADAPPLPVDAKAEARAKKKADLARKIAERDAREAEEYSALGSHIRGAGLAGSSGTTLTKEEIMRREAAKLAGQSSAEQRVPFENPTAEQVFGR